MNTQNRPKPHLRLHVSVGKHSGSLYWWVTHADDVNAHSVTNQRHPTVRGALDRARTRMACGSL